MIEQIWSITRKDLKIWAKKPGQWAIIFLVPFLFIWIMGAIFGRGGTPTVAIFVANEDLGQSGAQVVKALQTSENLEVTLLTTRAEADRRIGAGERMVAVVIPPEFSQNLPGAAGAEIHLIVDPASTEKAKIATGLIQAALAPFIIDAEVTRGVNQGVDRALKGVSPSAAGEDTQTLTSILKIGVKAVVANQVQEAMNNPLVTVEMRSAGSNSATRPPNLMESIVPGYTLMFGFFLVSTLAITLVEERSLGTLSRILVSPATRPTILLGKMLPYYILAVAQVTALFLVGHFVFGIGLGKSPLAFILIILCLSATEVGLGIMIAALVKNEGQAGNYASLLIMVMAVVGGSMFPGIRIPIVEYATPHYWAIQGFQNIITRGMSLDGVLLPGGILLGMALIFFIIGVRKFKFDA